MVAVGVDDLDPALVEAPVDRGAAVVGKPVDEVGEVVDGQDRGRGDGLVVGEVDAEFGAADVKLDELARSTLRGLQAEDVVVERGRPIEVGAAQRQVAQARSHHSRMSLGGSGRHPFPSAHLSLKICRQMPLKITGWGHVSLTNHAGHRAASPSIAASLAVSAELVVAVRQRLPGTGTGHSAHAAAPSATTLGRTSAHPDNVEDVDPALVLKDQVSDHPGRAERQGPYSAARIVLMQRVAVPRHQLQHAEHLGVGGQGIVG
jgi:hypothetical protein